jgi:hypothetical protein
MNEHCTPEANRNTFDGDAISRADREFLASLSDHPLVQHPLYSIPPRRGPIMRGASRSTKERRRRERAFRLPSIGCW